MNWRNQKKRHTPELMSFCFSLSHKLFQHINAVLSSLPTQGHGTDVKQLFLLGLDSQSLNISQLLWWVSKGKCLSEITIQDSLLTDKQTKPFHLVLDEFSAWRHACYLSNKLTGLEEWFACHSKPTLHWICKLDLSAIAYAFRTGSQ